MTLELILWLVAGLIISEIIFIIGYKAKCIDDDESGEAPNWIFYKIISLIIGGFIVGFHALFFLVHPEGENPIGYIGFLYEGIIILIITILFGANKLIAEYIDKKASKKVK